MYMLCFCVKVYMCVCTGVHVRTGTCLHVCVYVHMAMYKFNMCKFNSALHRIAHLQVHVHVHT